MRNSKTFVIPHPVPFDVGISVLPHRHTDTQAHNPKPGKGVAPMTDDSKKAAAPKSMNDTDENKKWDDDDIDELFPSLLSKEISFKHSMFICTFVSLVWFGLVCGLAWFGFGF